MLKRLIVFLKWLFTGDGSQFFPVPEKPVVRLEVNPEVTIQVIKPVIPSEHDAVLNAASTLVAGAISRGGQPDIVPNVLRALEIHRHVGEHLSAGEGLRHERP